MMADPHDNCERDRDHRRPPRPPFESAPNGLCRMCGNPVPAPLRRWHKSCLNLWLICSDPQEARRFVFMRDRGKCAECDIQHDHIHGDWHVDHKLRLADAPHDLRYWMPQALQTLCVPCHTDKTVSENLLSRNKDQGQ